MSPQDRQSARCWPRSNDPNAEHADRLVTAWARDPICPAKKAKGKGKGSSFGYSGRGSSKSGNKKGDKPRVVYCTVGLENTYDDTVGYVALRGGANQEESPNILIINSSVTSAAGYLSDAEDGTGLHASDIKGIATASN